MEQFSQLPQKPGVYLFKNKEGRVIYVGKAKNIKKRVSSYLKKTNLDARLQAPKRSDGGQAKTLLLVRDIVTINFIEVTSEIEAFLLEAALIKKHKPHYNIKLIDDKSYPFIKIGKGTFPYIQITRKLEDKNAVYYGPYTEATTLTYLMRTLRRIFPYQSVKNHPKRNCLYYHLKLCPCLPNHPEARSKYMSDLRKLENFLKGKTDRVLKKLARELKDTVKHEQFEDSEIINKQIQGIERMINQKNEPEKYAADHSYRKKRVKLELLSLQDVLESNGISVKKLHKIECYDISNTSGTNATGSMVVFIDGVDSRANYRKFRIRGAQTPDDFRMHKEVMERRLNHVEWALPDLFVIDGGKGQVSAVGEVFKSRNIKIPMIGLAKREETIVIPHGNKFIEVTLPKDTPGINLLRRIRDEAHRFAITYHKKLRAKNSFT